MGLGINRTIRFINIGVIVKWCDVAWLLTGKLQLKHGDQEQRPKIRVNLPLDCWSLMLHTTTPSEEA